MIWTNILTHRVQVQSSGTIFQKKHFLVILAAILNFCIKDKNTSRKWCEIVQFGHKFGPAGYTESSGTFLPQNIFQPLLATILNFCMNRKNTFIWKTARETGIWMKILAHRLSAESSARFFQKSFTHPFGCPS